MKHQKRAEKRIYRNVALYNNEDENNSPNIPSDKIIKFPQRNLDKRLTVNDDHGGSRGSKKFCNILVQFNSFERFLPRSWRWRTALDCEILNSLDTLRVLFAGIAYIDWSTASKSIVLDLPDCRGSCISSETFWTVINCAFTFHATNAIFFLLQRRCSPVRTRKA